MITGVSKGIEEKDMENQYTLIDKEQAYSVLRGPADRHRHPNHLCAG